MFVVVFFVERIKNMRKTEFKPERKSRKLSERVRNIQRAAWI